MILDANNVPVNFWGKKRQPRKKDLIRLRNFSFIEKRDVVHMYNRGKSYSEISKSFGTNCVSVKNIIQKLNHNLIIK